MAHAIIDEIGQILPPSRNLAETLARAADYATQQAHPEVTLEHLLLALTEDPDAVRVLTVSAVEIDQLKGDVSSHLGRLEERSANDGAAGISDDLRQILEASAAAARGRRDAIDGAIVLAAIVGDGRSTAAHLLRARGMTFEEAIKALQVAMEAEEEALETSDAAFDEASAPASVSEQRRMEDTAPAAAPAGPTDQGRAPAAVVPTPAAVPSAASQQPQRHPPGATADEILASARQRVQGRIAPGYSELPQSSDEGVDDRIADEGDVAEASPASPEQQALPVDRGQAGGGPAVAGAGANGAVGSEPAGPGPHPAPPARRPLPPGAIRPELRPEPVQAEDNAAAASPRDMAPLREAAAPVPSAPSAPPPPPIGERARTVASDKETAIDEVLATIRKSSRPAPVAPPWPPLPHSDPTVGAPVGPPPGPGTMPPSAGAGNFPQVAPASGVPAPSRAPAPAMPAPGPRPSAPLRPTDRDFFGSAGAPSGGGGPAQSPARNPALPSAPPVVQPPPPPGRQHAGPPRAPLPGLPPATAQPASLGPPGSPLPPPAPRGPAGHGQPLPPAAAQQARHPRQGPGPAPTTGPTLGRAGEAGSSPSPELPGAPQRPRSPELALGQMVENIPRSMRVGIPVIVEARIARSEVKALADGLQGGGAVWRHELTVTKAMSVRLRAPDGGFFIETASPETQWIENTLGLITDDYASWRWTVTPRVRGTRRLQLVVSARTVGTDGLAAETALPDQIVNVKVRINFAQSARKAGGWVLAAVAGGVLARFGEDLPAAFAKLLGMILK